MKEYLQNRSSLYFRHLERMEENFQFSKYRKFKFDGTLAKENWNA